ncbi:ATP-binding cassette domain-containing protein, partial [Nocardioides sp. P5_C9_2]
MSDSDVLQAGDPARERKGSKTIASLHFDETAPLLDVQDLQVEFHTHEGVAHAVNGVSFTLEAGRTLGILGESGCGKSVTAQAIMGILDTPPARIAGGR